MMTLRLALIHTPRSAVRAAFEPILRDIGAPAALTMLEVVPGAPLGTLRHLLKARPQIVMAEAGAPAALAALMYRTLRPQSRLLLCETDGRSRRLHLRRADGIVTDPSEVRRVIERLRAEFVWQTPASTLPDLDLFRATPPVRAADAAYRILFVGDLSPASLAPDVLVALAGWADAHPHRPVEIWWAGDGDLSGVLAAQPLPPNLAQHFCGAIARPKLAELMARCGILVASADVSADPTPLFEALCAGLVVVANRRMPAARLLLQAGGPGWLFDPARPDGLAEAFERVLACDVVELDGLRAQGRRLAYGLEITARPAVAETLACSPLISSGALT